MKLFLRSFSSLPLNHSRRVVVSYKRKYVHEVLVNRLFNILGQVWCLIVSIPDLYLLSYFHVKNAIFDHKVNKSRLLIS